MTIIGKGTPTSSLGLSKAYDKPAGFGVRHVQILLLFLGGTVGYGISVGMSIAIVPMANASTANPNFEDYGWTKAEKDLVLSSSRWGYLVTQVPYGYLADMWSSQKVFAFGMLFCGVFHILTAVVAPYGGLGAVLACRIGVGAGLSCLLPCTQNLLSKWAPSDERDRLATFAHSGGQFGIVITMPIAGLLAGSNIGWPSIFYIYGTLAIIWSIVFLHFGVNSPSIHRSISQEEKIYIEENLRTNETKNDEVKKKLKTPWKEILTSIPMWALIIAHFTQNWGYATLLSQLPSYMSSVLNFKIETNGLISALPYLAMLLFSFPISWLSDFALKKGVPRIIIRKVSNTVAFWGPAIALACVSVIPNDRYIWIIVLFILAVGFNAGCLCGFKINHIDLSPNFSGIMISITSCIATIAALIAPLICAVIVSDENNVYQWNIVFYITAAIYFLGNLVFVICGKAEVQWWNEL